MAGSAQAVITTANLSADFDIGVLTPGKISLIPQKYFIGPIQLYDGGKFNARAGFFTEVNASIVDFGLNFYQLTSLYSENPVSSLQGGMLRIDGRSGQKLFQFLGQQGAAVVASIDNSGNFSVTGTLSGVGSGLTSLNASNISSGTLSAARMPLDSYRCVKAINANSTTSAVGGFDAMISYVEGLNSRGSNAARCLYVPTIIQGTGTTAGCDFETQMLAWLGDTSANGGVALSASSSPTLASVVAAIRSSALTQTL